MRITMIGASGFIGTRLIELLKENGEYEMKNIDLVPSYFFNDITVLGDIRNQSVLDKELSGTDLVVLLTAQHRDDVTPVSLYYDTNVTGMENTLKAMERNGVKRILFFSSVAIYGMDKDNPNEDCPAAPFNHYGRSKWQAEQVLQKWYSSHPDWNIDIIRPTVVFGERNRGNVYNLLHQIQSGKFAMIGNGENKKSMAYVGNIVAFAKFLIDNVKDSYNVYNYIDKPDFRMNDLVSQVSKVLNRHIPAVHIPYSLGMLGGYCFDFLAFITRRKLNISSIRVKKFCSTTEFDASKAFSTGFKAPFTLEDGLRRTLEFEFVHPRPDDIEFKSE